MENDDQTDFSDLQNNFIKQQAQISALKELVRKTEIANEKTSYTQEKVKNIAQRLTHIKSKVRTREHHDISLSESSVAGAQISVDNSAADIKISSEKPGSEKFLLLRQQMKKNKLKIAERENSKKEIEELVLQLKEKIDNTQVSLEKSTELGRSMTELSSFSGAPATRFKSSADLSFIPLNIDKERIKFLENRIKFLEKQLENEKELTNKQSNNENKLLECKEKECIIEAYTREYKNTDLLANQNTFPQVNNICLQEFESLKSEILNLKEINNILEQTRFDLTIKNSKLELEIQDVQRSFTKTEELNKSLQNQIYSLNQTTESLPGYEKECFELDKQDNEIVQDEIYNSLKDTCTPDSSDVDKIKFLEISLEMERKKVEDEISKNQEYINKLTEQEIEYNVLKANFLVLEEKIKISPKTLFSKTTDKTAEIEINKLKQQLDDSNKSMIKLKLKAKQLQKQIDGFGKISDVNNELIIVVEQNQKLQQKINDLETENNQLQLSLLNSNDESNITDENIYTKIELLDTVCDNKTSNIQVLHEADMKTSDRLQYMKNELYILLRNLVEIIGEKTIMPHSESITLEEIILYFNTDIEKLNCSYNKLKEENLELQDLLHNYINENTDLLDKIEKINKSNSSAESIVIVERLTQEEKDELAELEQPIKFSTIQMPRIEYNEENDTYSNIMNNDLCDSLIKLREESSELMYKIELFTAERKEVLDKMDNLSNENKTNIQRIDLLEQDKIDLEGKVAYLKLENSNLENKIKNNSDENLKLKKDLVDLRSEKDDIKKNVENITNLPSTSFTQNIIKFETHLDNLNKEIENYRKVNDKNSKLLASKKLAKVTEVTIEELKKLIQFNKFELQHSENIVELDGSSENSQPTKMDLTQIRERADTIDSQSLAIQDANSLQFKIQMLEKEYDIMKTLNEELKQQVIESFTEKQVTENHNALLRIDLSNKEETINILNSQLMDLYNSMEKTTTNLCEKEDALLRYQANIDVNVLEINNLKLENNENKTIIENHHLYEAQLQAKIRDLEKQNAALETKTVRQLDKLKKFAANIKKKNLDYNNLEEKIKVLEQKHNSNLSKIQEIDNISEKHQLLATNLFSVKNELDEKKQELDHYKVNLQKIRHECDALNNDNVQLQQKLSSQDENIEQNKNYIGDLLNEVNMKNNKLEELQVSLKEKNKEIEILEFEITNLNLANTSISIINNESILKCNELEKNYNQLLCIYDKDRQSFRDTIFRIDRLYELVDVKLNEYVSNIEALELENKNYKDIIFELEEIILSFEKQANILNNQFQDKFKLNEIKKETLINRLILLWNNRDFDKRLKLQELDGISEIDDFARQKDIFAHNNEMGVNAHQMQISESNLMRTQVKQNQTDDQALIENENKRLKDSLDQKETEIEMYQRIILKLEPSILLPINAAVTTDITELKTVINKDEPILQQILKSSDTNMLISNNENMLVEEKSGFYHPAPYEDEITSPMLTATQTSKFSFFDELPSGQLKETVSDISSEQSIYDKGKIEDLQRNVSDLEKYVENLENKIKQLTKINQEISSNKSTKEKIENVPVTNETILAMATLYEDETKKNQSFSSRIDELELEQKRLQEEKQALQIKSGKMMKKLKEYKVKVDQQNQFINTTKSTSMGAVDLDLTIQEEMKNEIFRLEKNTTETMKNLENEKMEKANLLKRINTLVATNERLVEKQEYKDIEINNLQRYIRDLNVKANPIVDCEQQVDVKYKKVDSCEKDGTIINEDMHLKGELEELQTMLDKEVASKCSLENQLKCLLKKIEIIENEYSVDQDNSIQFTNAEILNIKFENQNLHNQLSAYESAIEKLKNDSVIIMSNFNSLKEEIQKKLDENLRLNIDLKRATETNTANLKQECFYENKISELMSQLQYREIEKAQFKDQVAELEKRNQTFSLQEATFESNLLEEKSNTKVILEEKSNTNLTLDENNCIREIEETWNKKISDFNEIWKASILENGSISQESINLLQNKLDDLKYTHKKDHSLNIQVNQVNNEDKNSDIIKNMTKALENQELEIVILKDELALKSGQRDPYAQISYSLESSPLARNSNISNNKSELDLTLYMLHQKDMRCEELQLELINLLEERDTLQLKLSKAIRQNEDIKEKFVKFCEDKKFSNIDIPFEPFAVSLQKYEVNPKLYSFNNMKDENRERKVEIMSQDVANIPPEAVTDLVGVDITNSTQSASTQLLNWLWGK